MVALSVVDQESVLRKFMPLESMTVVKGVIAEKCGVSLGEEG